MRSIRYHPAASDDLLHEVHYYSAISPGLGERFAKAIRTAEIRAAENPGLWPPHKHGTRRVLDKKFKFGLVYLHSEHEIVVVAIARFPRKQAYWKRRLSDA